MSETDKVFDKVDTNHNGTVSNVELRKALTEYSGFDKHGVDVVVDLAKKDEAKDKTKQLNKKEFNEFAN